jgi:hypothetical protein
MMVERPAITVADIADWLQPHKALRIVAEALGDEFIAKEAIVQRLAGGKIAAATESRAWENYPKGATGPILMAPEIWTGVRTRVMGHLWVAGDMSIHLNYYDGHSDVVLRYYGVRFDPAGIRALVANAPKPPSTQSPERVKPELPDKGALGGGMAAPAKPVFRQVGAEEFASWWSPLEAIAYATTCVGSIGDAREAIWSRLRNGLIESASIAATARIGNRAPTPSREPEAIPPNFWQTKKERLGSAFWNAGDVSFFVNDRLFECFGVRLNPEDIRSTLQPQEAAPGAPQEELETPQKGQPVAEGHLRAWYDLYCQVYSGAQDTEANALKSAQGMFPGKSVSRESIRALRGAQKRGRKPTDTAK